MVGKAAFEEHKDEMADRLDDCILREELEEYVVEIMQPHLDAVETLLRNEYTPVFKKQDE